MAPNDTRSTSNSTDASAVPKVFIDANSLVRDAFTLARRIYDSGFRPEFLLVLWRGGTPVGIVIHEFLLYKGIRTEHAVVKAESYRGVEKRVEPRVHHLDTVLADIGENRPVLVVDDIFDTGATLYRVCEGIRTRTTMVKSATLYYKPGNRRAPITPDYYLRTTDRWIVFPHELMDLTPEEIREKDAYVHGLLE